MGVKSKPVVSKKKVEAKSTKTINYDRLNDLRLSENQQKLVDKILKNTITFCTGEAGTAKTWTTCYTALKMLSEGTIKKIILTKPIVEAGENIGFLKGSLAEKISPYLESFVQNFYKIIGEEITDMLLENNVIEFKPLAYLRGVGLDNSLMFLDEGQNCSFSQYMLYITRLGKNSKIVIAGDTTQRDVELNRVALPSYIQMIKDVKGVAVHEFTRADIVRNKILIDICDRYDKWKEDHNIK